jgi:ribonuclease HII
MDEVGRGAWAGPVVVGAVAIDISRAWPWKGDSKALSRQKREEAAAWILENSRFCSLGWAEAWEIDELGLSAALQLAYLRAARNLPKRTEIIIDGNVNYLPHLLETKCIIRADQSIACVSAASIIAKVARDKYMKNLAGKHPGYGFDSHVGYGTKRHIDCLAKHGISNQHRKSYKPVAALV